MLSVNNKDKNNKYLDQLMSQGNRPGGVGSNNFSANTNLGVILDQGTNTELDHDHLEVDDDDYQTTDSDEDDKIEQKVKTMESNLSKGITGKKTKTWNFVK